MINTTYIIYGFLGTLIIILFVWVGLLEYRLKRVFRGKRVDSLEDVLLSLGKELEGLHLSRQNVEKYLGIVESRLRKNISRVNTLRFNPFENSGSNQSFATAFLNEDGDGVVVSTLYSREKVGVYAKPVKHFTSEYTLSDEEKTVIEQSKN
ncbi:MAG TPA: DUF4446 family protein [Candidatus Paceibacterota bacterium]